jgi:predicted amino acid dehydrogenase
MFPGGKKEKVAFVAHPTDMTLFKSYIAALRPDKQYADELLVKLFEWTQPYSVKQFSGLGFDKNHTVEALLYMVPFLPEMETISVKKIIGKIDNVLGLAASQGCTVAAMGGFTSIVIQNLERDFSAKHGIRITSGNTLTAAIIIRSIERIVERFGIDYASMTMAIVGASGDIGSACAGYFGKRVHKIILAARSMPALAATADKLRRSSAAEVAVCSDSRAAIDQAECCIFVTSAHSALFTEKDFRPGTIVCDASAPVNVRIASSLRDDVFVYHGGIAGIPFPIDTMFDIGLASPDTFYGCQLEGLLMALHPELPGSWGRGNITDEKINRFLQLLEKYPAMHPVFTIGNIRYDEERLRSYAARWKRAYRNTN